MNKKLVIIFVTVFIDLVGFGIIIPLNPYLAKVFGANPFWVGMLMSIYSLMQFLFSPFWGQLSDRIGRRPVILISLFGGALAHLGFAFSATYWGLFLCRLFAGIFGGNLPAAMAYIADVTPPKDRSKGMGLIGAAFGLGFILGPAIGGIFAEVGEKLGHTPPFGGSFSAVIASAICFANFVSAYFFLPESRWLTAEKVVVVERKHRLRRILESLKRPTLGPLMMLFFLNTFTLAQVEAALFLFVQGPFGWTYTQASFGFAYIGVIMAFTQGFLIRRLLPKIGEAKMLTIGLASMSLGLLGLAYSTTIPILALAVTALALGNGLSTPALSGSISLLSHSDEQGNNLGVAQSLASLARIIGPVCGGWLFQSLAVVAPFWLSAIVAMVGVAFSLQLRGKIRGTED
jgi:multidrug resistance protein